MLIGYNYISMFLGFHAFVQVELLNSMGWSPQNCNEAKEAVAAAILQALPEGRKTVDMSVVGRAWKMRG